jgi:hypothetical protein
MDDCRQSIAEKMAYWHYLESRFYEHHDALCQLQRKLDNNFIVCASQCLDDRTMTDDNARRNKWMNVSYIIIMMTNDIEAYAEGIHCQKKAIKD